jgi:hypothetical protein
MIGVIEKELGKNTIFKEFGKIWLKSSSRSGDTKRLDGVTEDVDGRASKKCKEGGRRRTVLN